LALPFLYTPEQMNAHRLINRYMKDKGEVSEGYSPTANDNLISLR
jgi:hypothetical protein